MLWILPILVLLLWWMTPWRFDVVAVAAFVTYLPLVSAATPFTRVLWLHADRGFDPDV